MGCPARYFGDAQELGRQQGETIEDHLVYHGKPRYQPKTKKASF
jgi:hypothetical protein